MAGGRTAWASSATSSADYRDGVGFTRTELEAFRDATLPDLISPEPAAAVRQHQPRTVDRRRADPSPAPAPVLPALRQAEVLLQDIDLARGMTDDDRQHLVERGLGITNLVNRAAPAPSRLTATSCAPAACAWPRWSARPRPKWSRSSG